MKTIIGILLLAVLALASAAETDVTGKWSGSFNMISPDGQTAKESTALLMLKQNGTDISGSVGPNEDEQHAIKEGKIEGDKITLLAEGEGHTIRFNLVVVADRITGDVNMSTEGETRKAKIDVTRAK